MAKLERKKFKVFGENAPLDEIGQFGSAKATTKKNTKDIEEIQELDAWSDGWGGAVISNKNYPPMEEMTGAMNVMSYQTAYTLQEGIPEWNKDTTYYKGSIVKNLEGEDVKLYQSISNDNLNNPLSNTDNWSEISFGGGGLELCDIGMALYVDETKGLRRYLNGQIVDINTNTQAFLNRLKDITTLHPSLLCTEDEWQTAKTMSAFGQVGKFVFNYSGDKIVSVRIPRVVNVQGLFDLQNLGMTVEAGLPNIEATWKGLVGNNHVGSDTGAGYTFKTQAGGAYALGANSAFYGFNASRSSSIYGNSNTVQQEAIQYPYFIQIATGSETENNIVNDIELNNPYSLFDSKYSDHELNNLSWLKSEGQWNAKAVYTDAYDKLLKVYNGTETVEGLSVKLSTETYTDYDFVLNTADETFRLPIDTIDHPINSTGTLPVKGNGMTLGLTDGTNLTGLTQASGPYALFRASDYGKSVGESTNLIYPTVQKLIGVTTDPTKSGIVADLTSTKANLYLYFYVGETVQNANLIDAGRIGEVLPTKTDKVQAAQASMPSSKYIDLTLNASGSTYTAPANGYVVVQGTASNSSCQLWIYSNENHLDSRIFISASGIYGAVFLPVKQGNKFTVAYANYKYSIFRFVYTQGEVA